MLLAILMRLTACHPRYVISFPLSDRLSNIFQLPPDYDVCNDSPPELQDVYKQTLRPDIYSGILDSPQQPAEDYNILERSRCSVDSSINFSVCVTMHDSDAVTRQVRILPTRLQSLTQCYDFKQWDSICQTVHLATINPQMSGML